MGFKNCGYLLFFFFTFSVVAQETGTLLSYEIKTGVEDVNGTPYINDTFMPAKVIGASEISALMRYNAEKDEMEFTKDGRNFHLYKSDSLEIKMVNATYKYLQYETNKSIKNGYLVVLVERGKDKYSLYKKETITLVPKTEAKSSYDQPTKAHYRRDDDKFYITVSDKIVAMPRKKKELLALLPNNTADIENYLKSNKVAFDDERDLINLVKFMNTLK